VKWHPNRKSESLAWLLLASNVDRVSRRVWLDQWLAVTENDPRQQQNPPTTSSRQFHQAPFRPIAKSDVGTGDGVLHEIGMHAT
jgi:hypothetical protein